MSIYPKMRFASKNRAIDKSRGDKIDFSQITNEKGQLDWKNSTGKKVYFERKGKKEYFTCNEYIKATKSSGAYVIITYNNNQYTISTSSLKDGSFNFIEYDDWEYNIGDRVIFGDVDLTIIDRKRDGINRYRIYCNKCHFDSKEYYCNQKYREEYWISYSKLNRLKNCPCCSGRVVKSGINDIYTTAPQLIPYLVNKDDGYKNTKCSCNVKELQCPDCGQKLHTLLSNIYYFGNPCICNDGYSYPNRMIYYTVLQLNDLLDEWEREFSPDWLYPKRFDMYVKYKGIKYIIEMDGGLGHGNNATTSGKYAERKNNDIEKDKLAKEQGYEIIRIPCNYRLLTEIKDTLYNYLKDYLPLDIVNWNIVLNNCFRNIHKQMCEDYENTDMTVNEIAYKYHYSRSATNVILRNGQKIGWCKSYSSEGTKYKYRKLSEDEKEKLNLADKLLLENPSVTKNEISKITGLSIDRLHDRWKRIGLLEKSKENGRGKPKEVYVYKDDVLINKYNSTSELVKNSINDFGKQFNNKNIQAVCAGRRKRYMGLSFSYVPLE